MSSSIALGPNPAMAHRFIRADARNINEVLTPETGLSLPGALGLTLSIDVRTVEEGR